MVPDEDSSDDESDGQKSDSDSLGLDDDLGQIKLEMDGKEGKSDDDDDFFDDPDDKQ